MRDERRGIERGLAWYVGAVCLLTIVACLLVLAGWLGREPLLTSFLPGVMPMAPNSALGLLLLAAALAIARHEHLSRQQKLAIAVFAGAAVVLGVLMLTEYALGARLGIDRWLFAASDGAVVPPSPRASFCLVLLGLALLGLPFARHRRFVACQLLALAAGIVPYVALIGYAYRAETLYRFVPTVALALPTAVLLLLMAAAVFVARPSWGLMATVSSPGTGGLMIRRLLLPFILLKLALGWAFVRGADAGIYDMSYASALIAASTTLIFGALVAWSARAINAEQRRREAAEAEARRNELLLTRVVANAPVILFATDRAGRVLIVEGRIANRVRPLDASAVGQPLRTLFAKFPPMLEAFERALAGEGVREQLVLDGDAFDVWFEPAGEELAGPAGVMGVIAVATDVSERRRAEERLERRNAQLGAVIDATIDGILLVDEKRRVLDYNRRFVEMWGLPPALVAEGDDREMLLAAAAKLCDPEAFYRRVEYLYAHGEGMALDEIELVDGRTFERYGAVATGEDGRIYGRAWYFRDVTERKALERSMRDQYRQLQALDRLKNDFVNAVSHDLRTPLTSITGYAEFLEDGIAGEMSEQQLRFVAEIQKSTRRLEHLVNDLLDFARIQAGSFKLNPEPTDLRQAMREAAESLVPQSREAGVRLLVAEGEPLQLTADSQRVQQVLINLIGNALKFTAKGGTVTVRLRDEPEQACFEVEDTGVGIAEADVPKLFRRFTQLDAGARRGGTGLGLWISKTIVEAHGGTIGVTSAPGAGSTFWFCLPKQR